MLYILLPVHNRREITKQFINCLKEQTYSNYHLVVIDDGSTDGTAEMIREEMPNATILKGNGKLWWAGSLQKGFDWLKKNANVDDYVLIINDDIIINDTFLEKGVKLIKKNNSCLIQAQAYSQQSKQLIDNGTFANWKDFQFKKLSKLEEVNCLSTRGLIFSFQSWLNIGGFHPYILPHYASDYEFTIRAERKGFKLLTDSSFMLWADESTSGYRDVKDEMPLEYFSNVFRIKDLRNPLMWSAFILLASPKKYILQNIYRVWKVFGIGFFKILFKYRG